MNKMFLATLDGGYLIITNSTGETATIILSPEEVNSLQSLGMSDNIDENTVYVSLLPKTVEEMTISELRAELEALESAINSYNCITFDDEARFEEISNELYRRRAQSQE